MGDLPPPRGPVVRNVVPPHVELVTDALLLEEGREASSRVERTGGVLPLALPAHEQEARLAAEPVEVVALQVRDVVDRVVEVDGVAARAAAEERDVIDAAQAEREREQVGALQAEVGGVVGAE